MKSKGLSLVMVPGTTDPHHDKEVSRELVPGNKAGRYQQNVVAMAAAKRLALACCKIYVSADSRNAAAVEALQRSAGSHILHTFVDTLYNRVGFTLAGPLQPRPPSLQAAVLGLVELALDSIDLTQHCGSHPRLGVVDHICFHPIGATSLPEVAALGHAVASHIGTHLQVPVFLYGALHPQRLKLADLRRSLGYFKPTTEGQWQGGLQGGLMPSVGLLAPDFGPSSPRLKSGAVTIGACPWVTNYNIPLVCDNLKTATRIARGVSERGGGLAQVEAMALQRGPTSIEIACNLLDTTTTDSGKIQERVGELATAAGIQVMQGYHTGYSDEEVLQRAVDLLSSFTPEFAVSTRDPDAALTSAKFEVI